MGPHNELILHPIGRVARGRSRLGRDDCWQQAEAEIEIDLAWAEALYGLEGFSHIWVIWWLDRASESPVPLRVHPEGRVELEPVGCLATRSPRRPNPIALTAVRLLERQGNRLRVRGLDAYQDTAILDIKPYLRRGDLIPESAAPDWLAQLWRLHDEERGS